MSRQLRAQGSCYWPCVRKVIQKRWQRSQQGDRRPQWTAGRGHDSWEGDGKVLHCLCTSSRPPPLQAHSFRCVWVSVPEESDRSPPPPPLRSPLFPRFHVPCMSLSFPARMRLRSGVCVCRGTIRRPGPRELRAEAAGSQRMGSKVGAVSPAADSTALGLLQSHRGSPARWRSLSQMRWSMARRMRLF